MTDLSNLPVSALANLDMDCDCGDHHRVPIRHILTGSGALNRLPEILRDFRGRKALLVGDTHTLPLAGDRVRAMLKAAEIPFSEYLFSRREHYLTDETAIGELLVQLPKGTELIVTIGSGTMNDISRVVSVRCAIPYVIIGTAPSMDGYASSTSAVIVGEEKVSVPLGSPYGIAVDPDLLVTAPDVMISAGIGDVLGKYTTLADWRLAHREGREKYCPVIAGLIEQACRRCHRDYAQILRREPAAVGDMADTLVMAGVAISMFGTSRPASGSEHQLAHGWEVAAVRRPGDSGLHGNFVGWGTVASLLLYREVCRDQDLGGVEEGLPAAEEILEILRQAGGWALKDTLRVDRDLFLASFTHAARTNPRYTILTWLNERGLLEKYAEKVTDILYP